MLTKSDKQWISEEITNQLRAFLEFELTIEKGPRKPGDPEKMVEKEVVNGIAFILRYFPLIEGALRGMQADVDRTVNSVDRQQNQMNVLGNVLLTIAQQTRTEELPYQEGAGG